MRLVRGLIGDQVVLAREEPEQYVVLATEMQRPGADVLREAIHSGLDFSHGGEAISRDELQLLAPVVNPSKIICVGLNYLDHAAESLMQVPTAPVLFSKFANAIIGPGDPIMCPPDACDQLDYEAELVVVMGRPTRRVTEEHALQHVLGYTAGNDVSARDAQFSDIQWVRGKSFDTFAPLGPAIVTSGEIEDPANLRIQCFVNGELRQDDTSANFMRPVAYLIAYISRFITLNPGDLIFTGTPAGVGFARTPPSYLQDGDEVEVVIDRIGSLTNRISIQ